MTERILSTQPQIAQSQPASYSSTAYNYGNALVADDSVAEEPYTIKCVCGYTHADVETICCDECDSWQHYECYYVGDFAAASADDFEHKCVECHPRRLAVDNPVEKQRLRLEIIHRRVRDADEKKPRRPASKNHKKSKPSEVLTNGHHESDTRGIALEHSQTKRAKSQHRSQASVSLQGAKRSPSQHSWHNSHAHPLSPATTPPELPNDFIVHTYSDQFESLWRNDPGAEDLRANSFASLAVTNSMSSWIHDEQKLLADTGASFKEAFNTVKPEFDYASHPWPKLRINTKTLTVRGTELQYRYLTIAQPLHERQFVGELKGSVGFQRDYSSAEPAWARLCHPAPFVFFHHTLPLYIDTRTEGDQCRYVRRSCQPNSSLEAFITNGSEYHFCFVSEKDLGADAPITMGWDFKFPKQWQKRYIRLLGLSEETDGTEDREMSPEEYQELSELINNVLSDYGGCACDSGHDCAFVRFHRNYLARMQALPRPTKAKKTRRPKQHVSPVSTGHSRDNSEGRQETYDSDSRSTSVSVKARSRDLTPSGKHLTAGDMLSDREKRKLGAIEQKFAQMDQQEQPPLKKKKRGSDGAVPPTQQRTKAKSVPRSTTTQTAKGSKSASRHQSASPADNVSPKTKPATLGKSNTATPADSRHISPARKPQYAETGTQTDPEAEYTWYNPPVRPKRKIIPFTQHILNMHARQVVAEKAAYAAAKSQMQAKQVAAEDTRPDGSVVVNSLQDTVSPVSAQNTTMYSDVIMADASPTTMPPPQNRPGTGKPVAQNAGSQPDQRTPDLNLQLSPQPQLSAGATASPSPLSGSYGMSSPAGSITQSPSGATCPPAFSPSVQASVAPPKKKMSLKDYQLKKAASATPALPKADSSPPPPTKPEVIKPDVPVKPASEPHIAVEQKAPVVDTEMTDAPPLAVAAASATPSARPSAAPTSL